MKNIALLISFVFGVLHTIYFIFTSYEKLLSAQGNQALLQVQTMILMLMPYLIIFILAVVFNALAYFLNRYAYALTATVLYIFAGVVYIKMIPYVCIESIISVVGLYSLKKK